MGTTLKRGDITLLSFAELAAANGLAKLVMGGVVGVVTDRCVFAGDSGEAEDDMSNDEALSTTQSTSCGNTTPHSMDAVRKKEVVVRNDDTIVFTQ